MSLISRLKKNSIIKESDVLSDSKFFTEKDMISVPIPILNAVFSGSLHGGYVPGITQWAGPSKHFKSLFGLIMMKSYMDLYEDSVAIFYDSEFGAPRTYFESLDIDQSRVLHIPLTDVEVLKFDIMQQLKDIQREDKVFIMVDSIGNLASKKEVEDAFNEKSVADMTRAKQLKSLFRMVTPYMTLKDIPMVVINHTYKEISMFPKDIVGGGTGSYYSADNIYVVGRQQRKEKKELVGYDFVINVEKSRFVKEKSKFIIELGNEDGISRWSGLLEQAMDAGFMRKNSTKPTTWSPMNFETGEIVEDKYTKDQMDEEFWQPYLDSELFNQYIEHTYKLGSNKLLKD